MVTTNRLIRRAQTAPISKLSDSQGFYQRLLIQMSLSKDMKTLYKRADDKGADDKVVDDCILKFKQKIYENWNMFVLPT